VAPQFYRLRRAAWFATCFACLCACLIVLAACGRASSTKLGNDTVKAIDPAIKGGAEYSNPLDAALDPEGVTIYFTAQGSKGSGVFKVPAAGGDAVEIVSGAPFASPAGIAVGTDGKALFVADAGAAGSGALLTLPTAGGAPTALRGSAGTAPRNLDIVKGSGGDLIYFTGIDPQDKQPGLFTLPPTGADAPTVVAKGSPFAEPDGVAVTKAGVAYVADRAGKVFRVEGGKVSTTVNEVKTGQPAGIALTLDDGMLLVSAIDKGKGTDRVLLVALANGETGAVTKVVGENRSAGGVHRALNANVFSWSDLTSGPGSRGRGMVYRVAP
jgi:DNA-binding beta-propeller fold protein YncE